MVTVELNYKLVNSDERFDHYDVSLEFYDGETLIAETVVSQWGVPIGISPADTAADNLRESLQETLNHIEAKYQQA